MDAKEKEKRIVKQGDGMRQRYWSDIGQTEFSEAQQYFK